ncbi:MAG: acetolactate synthase large subunit [Pseudomonadales bacterium]|nr:acetolactate synthase large subunit [Pseudomonadales bacterium]
MNGAEALIRSLVNAGVDTCFANPGTSEMHLVQAIDGVPAMHPVLCLFEGVCTGAADGYARMRGTPAATLLHLGAGLANGVANLHNARRAATPIVNLVGDHGIHHVPYDAPLTADIEGIAAPVSAWVRTARTAEGLAGDGLDAVIAALTPRPDPAGNIATLIIPADCAWGESRPGIARPLPARRQPCDPAAIPAAAAGLGPHSVLLLDGNALSAAGLAAAGRIAAHTGCRVFTVTFPARVECGPGVYPAARLPYFPEQIIEILGGVKQLVLVGAEPPVSFFAYRQLPSYLVPDGCTVVRLNHRHEDGAGALSALAAEVGAIAAAPDTSAPRPALPNGPLNTRSVSQIMAALAPDDSIVATDSGGGGAAYPVMQRSVRATFLSLTGGSIGQGGPVAVGAALACPDRQTFALLGDGGAMYTNQFLWTAAREGLNLITVIFSNRSYGILDVEYRRLGINDVGARAASLFDLSRPDLDWVALAAAQGVPGRRAETCEAFAAALRDALAAGGPHLIEARVA